MFSGPQEWTTPRNSLMVCMARLVPLPCPNTTTLDALYILPKSLSHSVLPVTNHILPRRNGSECCDVLTRHGKVGERDRWGKNVGMPAGSLRVFAVQDARFA